ALEPFLAVGAVVDLDDAATHAGLAAHLDDAAGVAEEIDRTAHPPQVHLVGERRERGGRIDGHVDLGRNGLGVGHLGFLSTCCLNERSCSSQWAWSWSSQACRATSDSGRRRNRRTWASSLTCSSVTMVAWSSTRRWRLIVGAEALR